MKESQEENNLKYSKSGSRFQNQNKDSNEKREIPIERPRTNNNIADISPFKLNKLKKQSDAIANQKEIDQDIQMALKYEEELRQSGKTQTNMLKLNQAQLNVKQDVSGLKLEMPGAQSQTSLGINVKKQMTRESNPNSVYQKNEEEELKELERKEQAEIDKQLQNEKEIYKLADYFITVGIDNFQTQDEVYGANLKSQSSASLPAMQDESLSIDPDKKKKSPTIDLKFLDDGDDFERVISKLEIFVIKDQLIFSQDYNINGASATFTHPDQIQNPNEKWIDLRGDKYIYLKITYDDIKNCRRPITDLNFYKISRVKQNQNKMCIHVKQSIEPIPVKQYGDPEADQKFKKTKKIGKTGDGSDDMYNFYGDYDLTHFFEDPSTIDPQQKKNLCLCISVKKQAPTQDVILVIGQQIDMQTGLLLEGKLESKDMTMNWDVPEGYKKLAYSVGLHGVLNRLLCLKTRDLMKKKIKPKVLDRYPPAGQDRHYYAFPSSISDFCFPSGIVLKQESGQPEFFNFSLTDGDGTHIFGSVLIFDEDLSQAFKDKLKTINVKNIEKLRAVKAICVLSHYSFNDQFKNILKQLYRMQISNTALSIPIERYIINFMDEIPLPDEGKLCVQYEIQGSTASFFRPIDQHPPLVDKDEIENLFKCLNVDSILEIFTAILLERKILFISQHKALLTQVINCFVSFIFPFQWKHSLIPILPSSMIDILDAPFPFIIGIDSMHDSSYLDFEDVIRIDLDVGQVTTPEEILLQSQMPKLPSKEGRQLKQRLLKASEHITMIPDQQMLMQIDLAFNMAFVDPDEDFYINHYEVRDSFLEFMCYIMKDYTKFIKDPSQRPEEITQSKDFFDIDRFRMQKDAKKQYSFIYKLTDTIHFSYFIESRCFGKSNCDHQIMHFDKLINEKRSRMKPRLLFPFSEEKSISTLPPNDEGIEPQDVFNYRVFPKFDPKYLIQARAIQNYNIDSMKQQIMGSIISNEELIKMHNSEFARYQLEIIYLLWFQVFCSTLPIYSSHATGLIEFSKNILNHIRHKIKPMRDIEFIYRRLFESCGTTKQITELRQIYKEMIKNKIEPNKVTSGVYYQALLQCKRRAGTKEANQDFRKSYFQHRMEDYQEKLKEHQDDDNRSQNRASNLSLGMQISSNKNTMRSNSRNQSNKRLKSVNKGIDQILDTDNEEGIDFNDLLGPRETTQQTNFDTQSINRISNPQSLSYILENSLYFDINKECMKCKQQLREEELFTGFQKNLSSYTVKCPICKAQFVPKFTIYSETENQYIDGKKGKIVSLLPPLSLYKDFLNAISNNGDQIIMSETFIQNHKIVFWNIILYFKILNLPIFMLDLDYSPFHQKQHCQMIKKFLPFEKNRNNKSFFSIPGRKNSKGRNLPPKLDSNALKSLNQIDQSPNRFGGAYGIGSPQNKEVANFNFGAGDFGRSSIVSGQGSKRPSSIKRAANAAANVFSVFGSNKKKESDVMSNNGAEPSTFEPYQPSGVKQEFNPQNIIENQYFPPPPKLNKEGGLSLMPPTAKKLNLPTGGSVQGIHFQNSQTSGGPQSQAVENDRKGIQNMLGDGIKTLSSIIKKPSSQKSGGRHGSQKSGGLGSQCTSLSDLEKIEKIMNEAKYADKSVVKYFGSHFEEFRREMHYNKEIVFSEMFTGYGASVNENAIQNGKQPSTPTDIQNQNPQISAQLMKEIQQNINSGTTIQ